mgnify:CR=1 FL=1
MKKITIAIDGYSSCGKSTMAKDLAKKIGYIYVDTGAMFRAIALYMTGKCVKSNETDKVKEELNNIRLDIVYENGEQQIILNDENVSRLIRNPEISKAASEFAQVPEVRERLLILQRELADKRPVVMDGRDIGTNVFKDAQHKFFLTATAEERANRRFLELKNHIWSQVYKEYLEVKK